MRLIIDAYNVIHKLERYRKLIDDLDLARQALIDDCVSIAAVSGDNILIVFDAHQRYDSMPSMQRIKGVEVCYTGAGQSADAYIENICLTAENPQNIRVVTGDRLQQMLVAGRGVRRVTPNEFGELLDGNREEIMQTTDPIGGFSVTTRLDEPTETALKRLMDTGSKAEPSSAEDKDASDENDEQDGSPTCTGE